MKKVVVFLFFFFFIYIPVFITEVEAKILFLDGFNDEDASGWDIEYLTPPSGDIRWENSKWTIKDGRYGISFHSPQMRTISSAGNNKWSNYIYVLKLKGESGVDKNVVFRYLDKNNWYGFHLRSDGLRFGVMKNGKYFDNNGYLLSKYAFRNNVDYLLKVIVNENKVSFFVNNECLIKNLEIYDNFISAGRIGLYASTGDFFPYTSVWFDNVAVCTIDDPYNCDYPEEYFHRNPIILVPGHGASINFKEMFLGKSDPDEWQMVPGAHVYDNLLHALEENGYEQGKDLFVFYYNWLKPIEDSSQRLRDFINQVVATSSAQKVNLIGHSMGGLVSRGCLESYGNQCLVEKLITVGSPHRGVPEAYGAWGGGEIWKKGFINRLAFEIFLNIKKKIGETRREAILRIAPSTEEFLPNFSYFKNLQDNEIPFGNDYPPNNLLSSWGFLSQIQAKPNVVYGEEQPTLRWLKINKNLSWWDKILGNWPYGKPEEKEYLEDGDGTVSIISAYPYSEDTVSAAGFKMGHRDIVSQKEAVNQILSMLHLQEATFSSFLQDASSYLVFYLHSPAHLKMNLAGYEVFTGEDEGKLRMVIIANPLLKDSFPFSVVGDETGDYSLQVGEINEKGSFWKRYDNATVPGQEDKFTLYFDNQNGRGFRLLSSLPPEISLQKLIVRLENLFSGNKILEEKVNHLEFLVKENPFLAWRYLYRLRIMTGLMVKSGELKVDINEIDNIIDNIASYLADSLDSSDCEEKGFYEAESYYQEAQETKEEVASLASYPASADLTKLAAEKFILSLDSLAEASGSSCSPYLASQKSFFLSRFAKAILH